MCPSALGFRLLLLSCLSATLLTSHYVLHILGKLLEAEALHPPVLPLGLTAPHQVCIEELRNIIVHCARDKELIMKQGNMLDLIFKFHEDSILKVLSLQKGFPVNRTIEEAWKA